MVKSSGEAEAIMANASRILRRVDRAEIFRTTTPKSFPTFVRSELGLGPVLGIGGFSTVRQISATRLRPSSTASGSSTSEQEEGDESHLDVATARAFISKHCLRNGEARYAVKRLRTDLSEEDLALGILDLAIEAKFLTVISHPNIIKMRGLAQGDALRKDYFIVLDRLYGTLVDKMEDWKETKKQYKGFMKLGANKPELNRLLLDRLVTAYDLAAAFRYLHEHKMVYRDIKPEKQVALCGKKDLHISMRNTTSFFACPSSSLCCSIGFDVRGDVKVFDFGLLVYLDPKRKASEGLYNLTGRTGTRPYMAPEVALCSPYGKAADVYSYAILLWEILALKIPFEGMNRKNYQKQVVLGNTRLPLGKSWPPYTRHLISECWCPEPQDRSDFRRICSIIRGDLTNMTEDQNVLDRSTHMMERSHASYHSRNDSISSIDDHHNGETPESHGAECKSNGS